MQRAIILGANGRFGRAAVKAFAGAGWQTAALTRKGDAAVPGVVDVACDVTDPATLAQACEGVDVIVNAVNPPYPAWAQELPRITASVIAAARHTGATVLLPGNVYNYGAGMPPVLAETTTWQPITRKGRLRVTMEEAFRDAGVRTIILRGGDFIEAAKTGNWFDSHIAAGVAKGRVVYPGPLDQIHAWAYLPDLARAMVGLAARRQDFSAFEEFGFPGFGLTGQELIQLIEDGAGKPLKVGRVPWRMLALMALFSPLMREVLEMRYLWQVPHVIDGAKLARTLPDFTATPAATAIAASLPR